MVRESCRGLAGEARKSLRPRLGSGAAVVGRAVVDLHVMVLVMLLVIVRGSERRRGEREEAAEEEELLHNDHNGTNVDRLSLVL